MVMIVTYEIRNCPRLTSCGDENNWSVVASRKFHRICTSKKLSCVLFIQ